MLQGGVEDWRVIRDPPRPFYYRPLMFWALPVLVGVFAVVAGGLVVLSPTALAIAGPYWLPMIALVLTAAIVLPRLPPENLRGGEVIITPEALIRYQGSISRVIPWGLMGAPRKSSWGDRYVVPYRMRSSAPRWPALVFQLSAAQLKGILASPSAPPSWRLAAPSPATSPGMFGSLRAQLSPTRVSSPEEGQGLRVRIAARQPVAQVNARYASKVVAFPAAIVVLSIAYILHSLWVCAAFGLPILAGFYVGNPLGSRVQGYALALVLLFTTLFSFILVYAVELWLIGWTAFSVPTAFVTLPPLGLCMGIGLGYELGLAGARPDLLIGAPSAGAG